MKIVLFVASALTCAFAFGNSDDFINEINSKQNLWKAGRNFPENTPLSNIRGLLGTKRLPRDILETIPVKYHEVKAGDLPESFDARTKWSNCKSIRKITDQSYCKSGWAMAPASTISDRICIHSDGKLQPEISVRNLLSCDNYLSRGCVGGFSYFPFLYWQTNGLVTGGPYNSKSGCQPYPFPPCEHDIEGPKPACPPRTYDTPKCVQSCDNSTINFENDLHYGASAYRLSNKEEQIRAEIFKNGPVVAGFWVYEDFIYYKSGVYSQTHGNIIEGHTIRILGWGVENGTKYWLLANSWNEDWGDKGLMKIRRGVNECDIESDIAAGLPE